jgi:Negative regulator of sigma F
MMSNESGGKPGVGQPPAQLRKAVARDLRAARPLLSPVQRALALLPLALVTIAAVPLLNFFRSDLGTLGVLGSWGLSVLEALGGVMVVALALREAIPGRALSLVALVATFAAGLVLPFAVLSATAPSYTIGALPGGAWSDGVACFRTSATAAIPALLVSAALVLRAFPMRPVITGALYGLGSGLIADAGLRLYCDFTVPSHFIGAHGGAIVAALVAGAAIAKVADWIRI